MTRFLQACLHLGQYGKRTVIKWYLDKQEQVRLQPLSVTNNSVSSRTAAELRATWALLLLPTLCSAASISTLLFVTEKGLKQQRETNYGVFDTPPALLAALIYKPRPGKY